MTVTNRPLGARVPIGDHGLIGDTRSAALVAPDGSIEWWCVPRFDDPPLFARLVAGPGGGHFRLGPAEPAHAVRRCYRPGTATLCTTWTLAGAELELLDTLVGDVEGRLLPGTLLVRTLECRGGAARIVCDLAPRFGYGRRPPRRTAVRGGATVFEDGDLAVAVMTDATDLLPAEPTELVLPAGARLTVVLSVSRRGPLILVPPDVARAAAAEDEQHWAAWSGALRVPPVYRDVVTRSLITLRLLTYSPSGAPVAAPTTSLPELIGGQRNWDYRFAWPRDASIGIAAFLAAGQHEQARDFLAWLLHASRLTRPHLPVLFTVLGRRGPAEQLLPAWTGYAGSRPVRRGNAASSQHQLDGYGWVLDGAWRLSRAGHRLYPETWRTMAALADHVAATWRLPDAGIWEMRGPQTHRVHSKLMGWVALDRAIRIARQRGGRRGRRTGRWVQQRDALAADIRCRGVDAAAGTYTAAYGRTDLDAALLLLPGLGFEAPTSVRARATVDAVRDRLSAGGPLVYRYLPGTDDLPGGEGAFLPCSFWLVEALALTGRVADARELFEQLCVLGGPLGLFAEEMDPASGEQLGNYPQALTHAALVQAATALAAVGMGDGSPTRSEASLAGTLIKHGADQALPRSRGRDGSGHPIRPIR